MSIAIELEGVSKQFPLTLKRDMSLRRDLMSLLRRKKHLTHTALADIHLTVQRGEGLAIVGRNGAGKSTLLRIIAGILRPTTGHVTLHGRSAALLGLNTGFSPDMTGRQNLLLGAALHGLYPSQSRELMRDIIEFADLGEFIDAPLRTYSSGMSARLGFSLMLHVMPEIMLVDEVVAVGDQDFREKSLARMAELRADQRTLLLVSHSEAPLRQLCDRAIWLDNGRICADGDLDSVLAAYGASRT